MFIICMQTHLFTVTAAANEHLKSQSKQSSNNSCCLDMSSLLMKLEKEICVSSILSRYNCDRKMTSDFKTCSYKSDEMLLLHQKGLEKEMISCRFEIKITIERNLDVHFQLNDTNNRFSRHFLTHFVLLFVKCSAGVHFLC